MHLVANGYVSRMDVLNSLRSYGELTDKLKRIAASKQKLMLDRVMSDLGAEFKDRKKIAGTELYNVYCGIEFK